tara:strand:- start:13663 stop:14421 length:759 start_codon:yes stop_codon:yes gene_type:complete
VSKGHLFYTKNIVFAFLFLSFFTYKSQAQESSSVFEQVWFQYYNKAVVSERWSLSTDVGYRLKEGSFVAVSQYFIRSGVAYNINPSVRILMGMALFKTHTFWDNKIVEFRPHQQLTTKHKFGTIGFGNRIRMEERFVTVLANEDSAGIETFNFRFRYRFLFNFPLIRLSKKDAHKKLSLVVGDEIILSTGKGEFLDFSAQNRFLVGPAVKINKKNTFLLLYNFTSLTKDIPKISEDYGVLWVGYKQTLDFQK